MIIDAAQLKQRYLLRIAGVRDKKVYIGPALVSLNITNSCNLRCRYCCSIHAPGNSRHLGKNHFLSWETFVEIVRDCVDLNVDQINITGWGEPTIHPLFRDMMRHLERQPIEVAVFTNGTFPLDYCSDVMKADQVRVNMGAVDSPQYLVLHGKDFFDHVMANIMHLASLRDTDKPGFIIDIAYVVNALNVGKKEEMQDLACRLGVHKVFFMEMSLTQYNKDITLGDKEKSMPPACLNGWFYISVTPYKKLSTCCEINQMSHGDLDKESFKNIWLSPHMMKLRLLGKYGHIQKNYNACQTCLDYYDNMQRLHALARSRRT